VSVFDEGSDIPAKGGGFGGPIGGGGGGGGGPGGTPGFGGGGLGFGGPTLGGGSEAAKLRAMLRKRMLGQKGVLPGSRSRRAASAGRRWYGCADGHDAGRGPDLHALAVG
jgi:hypothetical protein